ncbi:related to dihydropteroate synthase [Lecanosticta acicola]|uniref:Related to dihydropteroate synthase n=1 Tax=Lecanosticta acicola TaxID=111012 RepID=A0AAI8Z850_9PEZI|nr:related to dihydropteroate synthase [Lecanosticta acicola]
MEAGIKRKAHDAAENPEKRARTKKQWRVPRKNDHGAPHAKVIEPGDSGVWITCQKGKEVKCIGEMKDLFADYGQRLYPQVTDAKKIDAGGDADGVDGDDIEKAIRAEVDDIRKPQGARLFTPVSTNMQCVIFFKTSAPVDPVSLVKTICEDAMSDSEKKRTRFAKRLSPMTLMGRASTEGLEKVAQEVLAPHFHQEPFQKRKFAIRPTLRNHNILTRDSIIKQVASIVGPGHQVDLTNYDLLIVVEVYQNVCGVSVFDDSFEKLKRYNISEIFDPTPREENATS